MKTPRYGNGGAKGTRQLDDTPLSDGFVAKADWKNITEHQRRGRDSRRQVGAGKATMGLGGMMVGAGMAVNTAMGRSPGHALHEARHITRMARGKGMSQFAGGRMAHIKEAARETGRETRKYPVGAEVAGGGAIAAGGAGLYGTGKLRERHHDKAIADQRKSRVNKKFLGMGKKTVKLVRTAPKQTWRDPMLDAREANAARVYRGVGKAFTSTKAIARLRGTGRNPFPSFQQGPGAAKLQSKFHAEQRPDLARRAGKVISERSDRAHFNNPKRFGNEFAPKQSNFTASGVGKAEVSKTRHYDPEHRRQQRLGAATALLATGGGVAGYKGVRGAMKTTRLVRGKLPNFVGSDKEVAALRARTKGAVSAHPKDLALLGGSLAGIGGAGAVQGHANSRRGKGWD